MDAPVTDTPNGPGSGAATVDTPHVQVILDENQVPGTLRTALNRVNARVSLRSLDKALTQGISPTADVCVILPRRHNAPDVLGQLLADASMRDCATLVFDPGANHRREESPARTPGQETESARGLSALDEQLRLASEIQRDLLPGALPETSPLSIEVLYLPAEYVSGDIYDVSRLDEERIGLSIADATGHGLPAALLTIFVKNSFRGKAISGDTYRILEPDEVLAGLNAELLNTRLSGGQFITGLHAVLDRKTRLMRWARGGIPYPVLIRPGEAPRRLASHGGLMGAFADVDFEVTSHEFLRGDTLLLFTDGLEALLLKHDEAFSVGEIQDSAWVRRVAAEGPVAGLEAIRALAADTPEWQWHKDDITVLAVSM
jgi:hypothetical protein